MLSRNWLNSGSHERTEQCARAENTLTDGGVESMKVSDWVLGVIGPRVRSHRWLFAILPFFLWGLRSTLINGLVDPLRVTKFRGDFSGALFDLFWWQGVCRDGELVRGLEAAYGPLFTLLHHAVIDSQASCGVMGLTGQTRIDLDLMLYLVTAVNLVLIVGSLWLMRKLFELDSRQTLLVATLWLVDFHLGFSLGVAAILEFLELFLLLAVLVAMRDSRRSSQISSGLLLGLAVMVKVVPVIFLPLLLLNRERLFSRVVAFFSTIVVLIGLASAVLMISPVSMARGILFPELALTTIDDSEFRSLSSSIARLFLPSVGPVTGQLIMLGCLLVVGSIYIAGIWLMVRTRYLSIERTPACDDRNWLLLVGLFFSLLPLLNIAHRHTFVFLAPVYAVGVLLAPKLSTITKRAWFGFAGALAYIWVSQSLLSAASRLGGVGLPAASLEESIPTLLFSLLFLITAWSERRAGPAAEEGDVGFRSL